MKQYIVFITDNSYSMRGLTGDAMRDYNVKIEAIKNASEQNSVDTFVSLIKCGTGDRDSINENKVQFANENIKNAKKLTSYEFHGNTPLIDAFFMAIDLLKGVFDYNDPEVSFLIDATTDGDENSSRKQAYELKAAVSELIATDRWTFTIRVPRGARGSTSNNLGIAEHNILEWEQTSKGFAAAAASTTASYDTFYKGRSRGITSTESFYTADMSDVTTSQVKAALVDVGADVKFYAVVPSDADTQIRDFVETKTGEKMLKGSAFYQLTKSEDKVQAYKCILVREIGKSEVYYGDAARDLMKIPHGTDIKLKPGDLGNYEVFIQSTSTNRKVKSGTAVAVWSAIGTKYKEGKSA